MQTELCKRHTKVPTQPTGSQRRLLEEGSKSWPTIAGESPTWHPQGMAWYVENTEYR
jgi:hypothetical protein